jgi:beta-galactosidase
MGVLTYKGDSFYMDGQKYRVFSGAMHYFRIPREYWHDRLLKLKECGFNTVETYTCWNLHEPREGEFDFSGDLDVAEFIAQAGALGLNVILRPGPYICAEWEFGGLPAWLLKYEKMPLLNFKS